MAITATYGAYTIPSVVGQPSYSQSGRQATYSIAFLLQGTSDVNMVALEIAARAAINKKHEALLINKGASTSYTFSLANKTAVEISGKFDRLESVGFCYLCRAAFTIELPSDVLGTDTTGKTPHAKGFAEMVISLRFTPSELMMVDFSGVYTAYTGVDAETAYGAAVTGAKAVATLWLTDFGGNWELLPEVKTYNEEDTRVNFTLTYQQRLVAKGASGTSYKWRSIRVVKDALKMSKASSAQYTKGGGGAKPRGGKIVTVPVGAGGSGGGSAAAGGGAFIYNINAIIDVLVSSKTYTSQQLEDLFNDDIKGSLLTVLGASFESDAKIDVKRLECDPVQNTIVVNMTLKQANSAGLYTLRYKESLIYDSMSRILNKPDSKSHTVDIFEPGAEVHMIQTISATTEKPYNMWSQQFMPAPLWKSGTPGWKLKRAQDDIEDEVIPEDADAAITYIQFMTRTFIWLSSDDQARQAPQTDVPSAVTGRFS